MRKRTVDETVRAKLRDLWMPWWRTLRLTYQQMSHGVANIMAAAIAFYALICLGPLGILAVWALQPMLGPGSHAYEDLRSLVNHVAGETAGAIMGEIDALLTNPNAHTAGIVSIVVLVWAGLRLFEALELSLNEVWPGADRRGFVRRKLIALATMAVAGALLLAALLVNALIPTLNAWLAHLPVVNASSEPILRPGVRILSETTLAFVAFFLLFKFIPARPVPTKVAAVGGLFTAVAWKIVSPVFTMVIARSARNSAIYGGLAGVVMFLTWAFFSAMVLLIGAHFAAAYDHVFYQDRTESTDQAFVARRLSKPEVTGGRPELPEEVRRDDSAGPPG